MTVLPRNDRKDKRQNCVSTCVRERITADFPVACTSFYINIYIYMHFAEKTLFENIRKDITSNSPVG